MLLSIKFNTTTTNNMLLNTPVLLVKIIEYINLIKNKN